MFPTLFKSKVVYYALFSLMVFTLGVAYAQKKVVILKPNYQIKFSTLHQERQADGSYQAQFQVGLFSDYKKLALPVPTGWVYQPIPTGWRAQPVPTGWKSEPVPTGWIYAPIPTGWRAEPIPTGWRYEVEWEFVTNRRLTEFPAKSIASINQGKAAATSTKAYAFPEADAYLLKLRFYLRTDTGLRFLAHEAIEKVNIQK